MFLNFNIYVNSKYTNTSLINVDLCSLINVDLCSLINVDYAFYFFYSVFFSSLLNCIIQLALPKSFEA